jgi:hypothetical protein
MKKSLFTLLLGFVLIGNIAHANTNDDIEEFKDIGKAAAKMISRTSTFPVSEEQMIGAVYTTRVEFTSDKLISPQGIEVDALNYPSKKLIKVNQSRWNGTEDNQRALLVTHEYLGILKADDKDYVWSQKLRKNDKIKSILTCNYQFEGRPYYLKSVYRDSSNYFLRGSDKSCGEGTADRPITSELLTVSSVDIAWTDAFKKNKRDTMMERAGMGLSWKIGNHPLHARVPLLSFSKAGKFAVQVFELGKFSSDGLLQPRHFATIQCETIEPQEP